MMEWGTRSPNNVGNCCGRCIRFLCSNHRSKPAELSFVHGAAGIHGHVQALVFVAQPTACLT